MNYIDRIAKIIGNECDMSMEDASSGHLLRNYALLCICRGAATSNRDVHDAWSAWCAEYRPNHKSLIPYDDLSPEIQELDTKYRNAIREVASDPEAFPITTTT